MEWKSRQILGHAGRRTRAGPSVKELITEVRSQARDGVEDVDNFECPPPAKGKRRSDFLLWPPTKDKRCIGFLLDAPTRRGIGSGVIAQDPVMHFVEGGRSRAERSSPRALTPPR